MRIALSVLLVAALAALTGFTTLSLDLFGRAPDDSFFARDGAPEWLAAAAIAWALFALAVIALRRVPERAAVGIVLIGSLAMGGAGLLGDPNSSTDSARYNWDGIVQNAGISPYAYVPADPALDELRPDWLYPAPVAQADGVPGCVGERISETTKLGTGAILCTALNRPQVPTIYPPLAELYFAAVRATVPAEVGYLPFQVAGLLLSLAISVLLVGALRRRGLNPRLAALWALCPFVVSEAVTNSHVDVLGALLALGASLLAARGRTVWAGIALGAAAAAKLLPLLLAPALLRRRPLTLIGVTVLTFLLLYVPYLALDGLDVIGYLPGYISEEGYEDGSRFALVGLLVPGALATALVALILAVTAGLVFWHSDPDNPWFGELVLVGVTLLALSPRYPWYALLLIPFVAMTGRWEWLAIALALTFRLAAPPTWAFAVALALALAAVLIGSWLRAGRPSLAVVSARIRHPLTQLRM